MARETREEKEARLEMNRQYLDQPYECKVIQARNRIWDWYRTCQENDKTPVVSVGGLDSITLLVLVRDTLGESVQGVSVSSLEDKSIQEVHKQLGVIPISPVKSKVEVLREYGFPVISKLTSAKISRLQVSGDQSPIIRAYMTGDLGPWGHHGHNDRFKVPDKWLKLFGGLYGDMRPDLGCKCAPFKISDQCCYWLKELPMRQYQEEHGVWPFLGLMQSEGGRRQYSLRMHGCNYVGKSTARSCPFNYFYRQDLLRLALELHVPIPGAYGEIVQDENGLRTTKAQRTGCSCCGYGIHLDGRPHHFDFLRESNLKEWEFWMYDCCVDEATGEKYGWGRVLDWIGVGWRDRPDGSDANQMSLFSEVW